MLGVRILEMQNSNLLLQVSLIENDYEERNKWKRGSIEKRNAVITLIFILITWIGALYQGIHC